MSKLYQYLINDIVDIENWLIKNNFKISSFGKLIVESVEQVQVFENLDEAIKEIKEKLITKMKFFNEDCEFNVVRNKEDKFDLTILTEEDLPHKSKTFYNIIESADNIKNYNRWNGSEFKIKRYICEPILENRSNKPAPISIISELLVFYRIYN